MKDKRLKILSGCLVVIVALFSLMVSKGIIVFDHSAQRCGEGNDIIWKDVKYISVSGKYHEGKTIAETKDGFDINEVEEDDSHTFLVVRSFLDQWLVVREDYDIPQTGKITKAYWNLKFIEDEEFLEAVAELTEKAAADFTYDNSNNDIYQYKGEDVMRELTVAYEDCPVPTEYIGYIGTINGRWCMISDKLTAAKLDCYYIPDEYISVLEKHWK